MGECFWHRCPSAGRWWSECRAAAAEQAAVVEPENLPSPSGRGAGGEGLAPADAPAEPARASQTWAMLIKRVYEVDPLTCPHCGGTMKVVAFIEPPQGEVIEKILRHCGLWQPRPPPGESSVHDGEVDVDDYDASGELTYVDEDAFWATF